MKNSEYIQTYLESCLHCDRPLVKEDGKKIGGYVEFLSVMGESIVSTTCWTCVGKGVLDDRP